MPTSQNRDMGHPDLWRWVPERSWLVDGRRFALRIPTSQNRDMGHPDLWRWVPERSWLVDGRRFALRMPTSQNRDMGHPDLWLGETQVSEARPGAPGFV